MKSDVKRKVVHCVDQRLRSKKCFDVSDYLYFIERLGTLLLCVARFGGFLKC